MCRTDFLGTGICPSAKKRKFSAYYPQGRLRIISAYRRNLLGITPALVEIASSCTGCRICDKQCYFTAELQPSQLFLAFGELIETLADSVLPLPADKFVEALAAIVGGDWVSHDPAICFAYAKARSPIVPETVPRYVVLPVSASETSEIVRACVRFDLPWVARGSGTGPLGALTGGVVIDTCRMNRLEVVADNWRAEIGPGVSAFALQKAAWAEGLRANVAEPPASVCSNVLSTNMHSLFSYAFGLGADHVIDAEFVDHQGRVSRLSQRSDANPFTYRRNDSMSLGICTNMSVRLFPRTPNESAILIPFGALEDSVDMAREIAHRRIGTALGILGTKYVSLFAGHTSAGSREIQTFLQDELGLEAFVLVIGARDALIGLERTVSPIIDSETIPKLLRALPRLRSDPAVSALVDLDSGPELYRRIFSEEMRPLLNMALHPSPEEFDSVPDEFQREFLRSVFARPEMTDPAWLNSFRILPARMGRSHQFVAQIGWLSMTPKKIREFVSQLQVVARRHGVGGDFGYLVPIDHGTRAVSEFDFYYDPTSEPECARMVDVLADARKILSGLIERQTLVCTGADIGGKGLSRYQSYLYGS